MVFHRCAVVVVLLRRLVPDLFKVFQVPIIVTLYDRLEDVVSILLVQCEDKILRCKSTIHAQVVEIAEGRIQEKFHVRAERFLAESVIGDDSGQCLEDVFFQVRGVFKVIHQRQVSQCGQLGLDDLVSFGHFRK